MGEMITVTYKHYNELSEQDKKAKQLRQALKQTNDLLIRLQGKVSGGFGELIDGEIIDHIWTNRNILQDETW